MRSRLLIRQLSMRSIRTKKSCKEEMKQFDGWIRREAGRIGYYGGIGEGFWTEAINGRRQGTRWWMDDDEEDNTEDQEDEWEDDDDDELNVDEGGEGGDVGERGAHADEDAEMRSVHSRVSMSTSGGSNS